MPGSGTGKLDVSTNTPPYVGVAGVDGVVVGGGGGGGGEADNALDVGVTDPSTTHDLTMPTAGSLPKKSFVHWPALSVRETHSVLTP